MHIRQPCCLIAIVSQRRARASIGLIGFGVSGGRFHANLIAANPSLELAAIATDDKRHQVQARRRFPRARVVPSVKALFEFDLLPDLVVVATPNPTHAETVTAALEAGVPVVVDKPLASTAEEAEELVRLSVERGVPLHLFQNRRWDGDFLSIRALIEAGRLGRVRRFESRFEFWEPEVTAGWREHPGVRNAGGVMIDLGAHLIDQAIVLFGDVDGVYAEMDMQRPGALVDDDAFISLHHRSGVHSHLWMSHTSPEPGARFRVIGDRAVATCHGLDPQESQLAIGMRPGDTGWGQDQATATMTVAAGSMTEALPVLPGRYEEFYARLATSLHETGAPVVDPADGIRTLQLLEAARQSAQQGMPVLVPPAAHLSANTAVRAIP